MKIHSVLFVLFLTAGSIQLSAQQVLTSTTEKYGSEVNVDHAIPINVFTKRLVSSEKKK